MLNFFKKENEVSTVNDESFIDVACLLVHVSKIDEHYSIEEKNIITRLLIKFGADEKEIDNILKKAEDIEKNSNQILDFTRKIKDINKDKKLLIVKSLWEIIYSDDKSDMFESNLMRRLTGLLYLNPKEVGDLKEEVKNK